MTSFAETEEARRLFGGIDYSDKRILLIDDHSQLIFLVKLMLITGLGFKEENVIVASDEVQAELILDIGEKFDILLTDNDLSQHNKGLEFIKKHRDEFEAVVLYTGRTEEEKKHSANSLDAAYLPKPFSLGELIGAFTEAFTKFRRGVSTVTHN